ncbi:MAG: NLP/P60 hydrolase [Cereibacter sphaeroides]|uniref:NLP/P60 hydrolase n=1 Tax=Cereibacter sphaeroides TaxID=1063 RepID=A0A2W5UJG3_CERSP|nr:MAG: NLP/P60 hydrolase [Cereibacter sphaeroides]
MDRRTTPSNGRVALESLRGKVTADRFVAGEPARVVLPLIDLCTSPGGDRDRQLVFGDSVTVIDRQDGWAFLQSSKDGYCGYTPELALADAQEATHWLSAPSSHLYPEPRVQAHELTVLTLGSQLRVLALGERFAETTDGFVPVGHLRSLDDRMDDPVAAAELFLGAPYLWGGNSRVGIDCSGLVQAALLACGIACPGDSDLQAKSVGSELPPDAELRRGDLLFWKGHVAMVADEKRIIHATGHVMAVAYEPIDAAINRIAATSQPVLTRRRP